MSLVVDRLVSSLEVRAKVGTPRQGFSQVLLCLFVWLDRSLGSIPARPGFNSYSSVPATLPPSVRAPTAYRTDSILLVSATALRKFFTAAKHSVCVWNKCCDLGKLYIW